MVIECRDDFRWWFVWARLSRLERPRFRRVVSQRIPNLNSINSIVLIQTKSILTQSSYEICAMLLQLDSIFADAFVMKCGTEKGTFPDTSFNRMAGKEEMYLKITSNQA